MDFFGNTNRNTNDPLGFERFTSATGDPARIVEVQSQISIKATLKSGLVGRLTANTGALATNLALLSVLNSDWNSACTGWDTATKCAKKRDPIMAKIMLAKQARIDLTTARSVLDGDIKALIAEIASLNTELASLLEAQRLEAQSTLTLAQQGTTPEEIKIKAQADADAITLNAQIEAQEKVNRASQDIAEDDRKSKSRKIIILSSVFLGLLLIGFISFRKIQAKKYGNKK